MEVWGEGGLEPEPERLTVGTLESNDVVVDAEGVLAHAAFERFGDIGASATSARATARS